MQTTRKSDNNGSQLGKVILHLFFLGIGIFIVLKVIGAIGNAGKYDGRTAEEWAHAYRVEFSRYQTFRSCVEDYDNFDIPTQVSYGGVFYYCE